MRSSKSSLVFSDSASIETIQGESSKEPPNNISVSFINSTS